MKQGQSSRTVTEVKTEPSPRSVHPGGVSSMGIMRGDHVTDRGRTYSNSLPLYDGRGFEAPANASHNTHKGGSQGRS